MTGVRGEGFVSRVSSSTDGGAGVAIKRQRFDYRRRGQSGAGRRPDLERVTQ